MKKCTCGEEWADEANFCGVCGKPLNKAVEHGQAQCSDASWCCEFRRNKCNGEACPAYTPAG